MPPRHTRPVPPTRGPVTPVHRGPQAAPVPASVALPYHAPNAALLIDFDNVTMGIRSDLASELKTLLSSDIVRGKVSVQRAYADWRRYPQYIVPLAESSIDLIYAPAYGSSKKNATDIRLAIDALELVFTRPEIGTFILLSGDSDFSSLVLKLKEYGKYVIGVGIRESASDLLVQNCDEYYSYNTLAGLVNTREEELVKWDPWELAGEAVRRMHQNGDVMRADRLKQVMQQIDSSFDEKNLGMAKFSRFVSEAARRGILSLSKMENGQYEVAIPVAGAAPSSESVSEAELATTNGDGKTPAAATASSQVAPSDGHANGRDDERRGGRNRRGRGRGRDREERRPRAEQSADAATPSATQSETASATQSVPAADGAESVVAAPAAAPVSDGIGVSGMRLTRDEAFDLVRRTVVQAAANGPVRTRAVREAARVLLGRDSESLSERNFVRILKDAHDADLVDLRRRGDDYEITPATAAESIAEQLSAADAQQAPARSAPAPQVPRGMGPRGIAGRGGRGPAAKSAQLPMDLLSIGMVDDDLNAAGTAAPAAASADSQADGTPTKRGGRKPAKGATVEAKANVKAEVKPAKAAPKANEPASRGRKGPAKKAPATASAAKSAAKKAPARKKTARA